MYSDFVGSLTLPPISVDTTPAWYPVDNSRFNRSWYLRPYYEALKIMELRSLVPAGDIHRLLYHVNGFSEASTIFKTFTGLNLINFIDYTRDKYVEGLGENFSFSNDWDCSHHLVFINFSPTPFKFLPDSKYMTGSSVFEEVFGSATKGYQYSFPFMFGKSSIRLTCDLGQGESFRVFPDIAISHEVEAVSSALKSNMFGFTLKDFSVDINRQLYSDINELLIDQGGFEAFGEALLGIRRNLLVSVDDKKAFEREFSELVHSSFVKVLGDWSARLRKAHKLEKLERDSVANMAQLLGMQHWKKIDSFGSVVPREDDTTSLNELFLPAVTHRGFYIKTQDLPLEHYVREHVFPKEGHMFFFRNNSRHEILMTCVPAMTHKLFEGAERSNYERGKLRSLVKCCDVPVDRTHLIPFGYHGQESDSRLVIMWPSQDNRGTLNDFERSVAKLAQCVTWHVSIDKLDNGVMWSSTVYDAKTGETLMTHEPLVFHGDVEWVCEGTGHM